MTIFRILKQSTVSTFSILGCFLSLKYYIQLPDLVNLDDPIVSQPVTSQENKLVHLFNNGASTGGVDMAINQSVFIDVTHFAAFASQFIHVHIHMNDEIDSADRIYTGQGKLVQFFEDIHDGDNLYLVAPGINFIWPFVKMGHKVKIYNSYNPDEEPMILESFHDEPRIFFIHNFINDHDGEKIIQGVENPTGSSLLPSQVSFSSEKTMESEYRTSNSALDLNSETAIKLKKKGVALLALPHYKEEMLEGLQVIRYKTKQGYVSHEDYYPEDYNANLNFSPYKGGSNRFATIFMYLNDVESGGQTVFPYADIPKDASQHYQHPENKEMDQTLETLFPLGSWQHVMGRKCTRRLSVYPKKGRTILFYSQKADGTLDPTSMHGGCPILQGTKWAANLWIWNQAQNPTASFSSSSSSSTSSLKSSTTSDYDRKYSDEL